MKRHELKSEILRLENRQIAQKNELKQDLSQFIDNMNPLKGIKTVIEMLAPKSENAENYISTLMGLTGGYLTKKIIPGNSNNPINFLLGLALQVAVTGAITKNGKNIMHIVGNLLKSTHQNDNKTENIEKHRY